MRVGQPVFLKNLDFVSLGKTRNNQETQTKLKKLS